MNEAGISIPEDTGWNEIPLYISNYKGIQCNELIELYPTDSLNLTGGFTKTPSNHNSQWASGYHEVGSASTINAIDFTNIKTLKIVHYLNKYASSSALPITVTVGITNDAGTWIKNQTRKFTAQTSSTYTETFDTSDLTGSYYITWSYDMYCRTQGYISSIFIQA